MDWDKLKIFHAVAEAGSFTNATVNLNLSQSAISRQIQSLEDDLKVKLFERHARGLTLTENGEYVFKTAHEVISKLKEVETTLGDKKTKPSRPIPSGIISKKHALNVGVSMLAIGAFLPLTINVPAGLACISLAISIVLYTILHHKLLPAILLMGICRGLVYIAALLACFQNPPAKIPALFACTIALYTMLLTLIGRIETSDFHAVRWLAWLAPLPIMIVLLMQETQSPIAWFMFVCLATLCGFAWNDLREKNKNIVAGMHKLLAGFAIVDCALIASLNENVIMMISIFCFVLTVAAHRKILGT